MKKNDAPVKNIAIIGLGLLGASLGMALRGRNYRRIAWTRREDIRKWALENDVADSVPEKIEDALAEADLTVLCLPIPKIIQYLKEYAHLWRHGAIVTDIGSVKGTIESAACGLKQLGVEFVGSHPMAGTEKSGPESAFATMYENAEVFIVPPENADSRAVAEVEKMWRSIGTRTVRIGATEHDHLVAHTSHVLHILASALALSILDETDDITRQRRFSGCATGFRDTSRIASSSPSMWREIIENNRPAVLAAMNDFEKRYGNLRRLVETGDFDEFERLFAHGKELRDSWVEYKKQKKSE